MQVTSEPESVKEAPRGPAQRRYTLLLAGVLLLVAVVVANGISRGEFHLNTDEAHHAFTGLYCADFLRDLPLTHPIDYTYRYYAHYPVLGLIHWPPLFYLAEGVVFLLLGPSVVSARLTVLLFALFGLYFWYRTVSMLQNERAALAATLILAFVPSVLLYEKAVMLEVPSMALCLAATYFWIRYLRLGASRLLYWFAFLAGLALLAKQQSIYLAPFCLLTLLAARKWRALFTWSMAKAFALCFLLAGPFYLLAFAVHSQTIAYSLVKRSVQGISPYLYYWSQLPSQIGWFLLVVSLLGMAAWRWWPKRQGNVFMLLWIAACYGTSTLIAGKEPRYILDWVPPFAYFAAFPFTTNFRVRWASLAAGALAAVLLVTQTWAAWNYQRPYISGPEAAARRLTEMNDREMVLFDADYAANFMFFVRTHDPSWCCYILRKALYVVRNDAAFGNVELAHTPADLDQLLAAYGVHYIVVDQNSPLQFKIQRTLREFLQTPQFRLVNTFPIQSNIPGYQNRKLLIYENTRVVPRSIQVLRLQMMTLNYDIEIPLDKSATGAHALKGTPSVGTGGGNQH